LRQANDIAFGGVVMAAFLIGLFAIIAIATGRNVGPLFLPR